MARGVIVDTTTGLVVEPGNTTPQAAALRKKTFLRAYSKRGILQDALDAAGISRSAYDVWRREDPEFRAEASAAGKRASASIERKQWDAAIKGDTVAQRFLLVHKNPEEFGDRIQVQATGHFELRASVPRQQRLEELDEADVAEGHFMELSDGR